MKKNWLALIDPPIKYRHLRHYDDEGYVKNQGGVTFAYQVDPKNRVMNLAWAMCCDSDNFCKKTGRTIATTRLLQISENYHHAYQLTASPDDTGAIVEEVNALLEKANDEVFKSWCETRGIYEEGEDETEAHSSAV